MAWPLSRITTYVAGVSQIAASAMNSIQDYVIGLYLGTYSHKAIAIDGTGGVASTPPDGTLRVSSTAGGGTSAPTPSVGPGVLYKYMIPHAMGVFTYSAGTPTIRWAHGVSAIADNGTGDLDITLQDAVAATNRTVVMVNGDGATGGTAAIFTHSWTSTTSIHILAFDAAAGALDVTQISFVIWAAP
jgi:hypothetical protein